MGHLVVSSSFVLSKDNRFVLHVNILLEMD